MSLPTVNTAWLSKNRKDSYKLAILEHIESEILTKQNNMAARTRFILDQSKKPIMSAELEAEIEASLAQYDNITKWKEWGMDNIRAQGNMVFLGGEPGTGKTEIATWMSKRVGRGITRLNMKDVGGKAPGHTERMVAETFAQARAKGLQTIFMDECEAIVWDRGRAGSDSMWMVGVIDEILMQIAEYKGLIVAASNRVDIIDPALEDRCFAFLTVPQPELPERIRLWKQKIPARFPLRLSTLQIEKLAALPMNGRQIVNCIVKEGSKAMVDKRDPDFESLLQVVKMQSGKKNK